MKQLNVTVTVVYATTDQQIKIPVTVSEHATVMMAIRRSGILTQFPTIDITQQPIGIYSRRVTLDTLLEAGDRIELYRPLKVDPKTARRLRARKTNRSTPVHRKA